MLGSWSGGEIRFGNDDEGLWRGIHRVAESLPVTYRDPCRLPALGEQATTALIVLQASVDAGSPADVDVTCVLAYCGIEIDSNIDRLLFPASQSNSNPRPALSGAVGVGSVRLAGRIACLYHRWKNARLLEWLLDYRPHNSDSIACQRDALIGLWDSHACALLRATTGHISRAAMIADVLLPDLDPTLDAATRYGYLRPLRLGASGRDGPLREASLQVLKLLKRRASSGPIPQCRSPERNFDQRLRPRRR